MFIKEDRKVEVLENSRWEDVISGKSADGNSRFADDDGRCS